MKKIYTVFGRNLEDDDMWAVRSFDSRADADMFCAMLNEIANRKRNKNSWINNCQLNKELRAAGDNVSLVNLNHSNPSLRFGVGEIDFGLPVEAKP